MRFFVTCLLFPVSLLADTLGGGSWNGFSYAVTTNAAAGNGPTLLVASWTNTTSLADMVFSLTSVPVGALITIVEVDEGAENARPVQVTGGSGTWDNSLTAFAATSGNMTMVTNAAHGGGNFNVTVTAGGNHAMSGIFVMINWAMGAATSATGKAIPNVSITPQKAGSLAIVGISDWAAKPGPFTYTNSPTILHTDDQSGAGAYVGYICYYTNVTASAQYMGVAAPGSQQAGIGVQEIKAP